MKTLLILTGPQGSGNHMWSKIFALHPQVQGWRALLSEYWIGHDEEPWAEYWQDPSRIAQAPWGAADWHVTSISVPYMNNGTATVPDFRAFIKAVQSLGHRVKIGIVGRDRNILEYQEQRVRNGRTFDTALEEYSQFAMPVFLSYELLHLYGRQYLQRLERDLEFPIAWTDARLAAITSEDTNAKYFHPIDHHPTDDLARHASRKKK